MRIPYKLFPVVPNTFPFVDTIWRPVLNVSFFYGHQQSRRIETIVDSGSPVCLFQASIGDALGMDVRKGIEGPFGGATGGSGGKAYYHNIRLVAAGDSLEIRAGFSYELSVPGLLGQIGFFDNFIVTFDNTPDPPCFEVHRIQRN